MELVDDMSINTGIQHKIQNRIMSKLEAMGATSREKAVTIEKANLNAQEQNWLHYIAGGLGDTVKKTEDKRYYITSYF
jgi:hypothetical protein